MSLRSAHHHRADATASPGGSSPPDLRGLSLPNASLSSAGGGTPPRARCVTFSAGSAQPISIRDVLDAPAIAEGMCWIDLTNPPPGIMTRLAQRLSLPNEAVEDCLRRDDETKLVCFREGDFVVNLLFDPDGKDRGSLREHELHMFLGKHFFLSTHRGNAPLLDDVRAQFAALPEEAQKGRAGAIFTAILDRVVSSYARLTAALDQRVEGLSQELHRGILSEDRLRNDVPNISRSLARLRRATGTFFDFVRRLKNQPEIFPREEDRTTLRELPERLSLLISDISTVEHHLEVVQSTHVSLSANKSNSAMKKIAVAQALFLPIMAASSFFGQNFAALPFNSTKLLVWTVVCCAATSAWMLWRFLRNGWLRE